MTRLENATARLIALSRTAVWPLIYSIALAYTTWSLQNTPQLSKLHSNKVDFAVRVEALVHGGVAAAVLAAIYLSTAVITRIRSGAFDLPNTARSLNRSLLWIAALPFIAALRIPRVEAKEPKWLIVQVALAALFIGLSVYQFRGKPLNWPAALKPVARYAAPAAVLLLWIGYAWFFSDLSITNHQALNTRTTDLGYYDNIFYQSLHGRPLGCTFMKGEYHGSGHFDPILVLLSPLYRIYGRAELLLVLQSIWLGSGVVPVFALALHHSKRLGFSVVMAALWVIYGPMHGANMYEFHSLTLIAPLVVWLMYFLERGAFKRYALTFALLLLCREDIPLLMCLVGVYAITTKRPGYARLGVATILVSLCYFVIVKAFFMTSPDVLNSGKGSYGFGYYFRDLIPQKKGTRELFLSLVTNPIYAIKGALTTPRKIRYVLQLFLPLGLLPFFAQRGRITMLYGLAITALASRSAVFTPHFQYSCWIFPFAFSLAPMALERIRNSDVPTRFGLDSGRLVRAWLAVVLTCSVLMSWKFGALIENSAFKGGFSRITRELSETQEKRYGWLQETLALIEPGASVSATNKMGPHISNRAKAYFYRSHKPTHYALIDERELKGRHKKWHKKRVDKGEIVEVTRHKTIALFRAVEPDKQQPLNQDEGSSDKGNGAPDKAAGSASAKAPAATKRGKPGRRWSKPRPTDEPDDEEDPREQMLDERFQ